MSARWVTFDCYGTLVDWLAGFTRILQPLAGERLPDLLLAYHRHEPLLQAQRPFRPYREVLEQSLSRAACESGMALTGEQARSLAQRWGELPVFSDVDAALAQLRAAGCKLGVLTNCDEDLFAETQRAFRFPFDLHITAERVRDYKPSLSHFRCFAGTASVGARNWVHVGSSNFHDIAPARELGIQSVWLDRERDLRADALASLRVESAAEVPAAVAQLFAAPSR